MLLAAGQLARVSVQHPLRSRPADCVIPRGVVQVRSGSCLWGSRALAWLLIGSVSKRWRFVMEWCGLVFADYPSILPSLLLGVCMRALRFMVGVSVVGVLMAGLVSPAAATQEGVPGVPDVSWLTPGSGAAPVPGELDGEAGGAGDRVSAQHTFLGKGKGRDCSKVRLVPGADLRGCDFRGVDLRGLNLKNANLKRADVRDTKLQKVNLKKVNFKKAKMQRATLNKAKLRKAKLKKAQMQRTNLVKAKMQKAKLQRANLCHSNLWRANLRRANLRHTDLCNASLRQARLAGVNVGGANLGGANLTGAISRGVTGTPKTLPDGWVLVNGVFVQGNPAPAATYALTYDGNTATGGSVPVDGSSPYLTGATVTVLGNTGSLAKSGYSFAGWNTAADGTGTGYAAADTFTIPAADTTLFAQWTINTYTLSYDGNTNDSGTAPVDQSGDFGTDVTVAAAGDLAKTGYTFAGWNTAADGTGTGYAAADAFTIPATDTTLYAQWTAAGACTVGATGPGGGVIFLDDTAGTGSCFEAAPADWNVGGSPDPSLSWGLNTCASSDIAGAVGTALGTGAANTSAITAACAEADAPAAWAAANYTNNGKSDWFLPSLYELNALDVSGVGSLSSFHYYWSSSLSDAGDAWDQFVGYGGGASWQSTDLKVNTFRVRPVRAF